MQWFLVLILPLGRSLELTPQKIISSQYHSNHRTPKKHLKKCVAMLVAYCTSEHIHIGKIKSFQYLDFSMKISRADIFLLLNVDIFPQIWFVIWFLLRGFGFLSWEFKMRDLNLMRFIIVSFVFILPQILWIRMKTMALTQKNNYKYHIFWRW